MTVLAPSPMHRGPGTAARARPAERWRHPAWSGARLRPAWLLFSIALHIGLLTVAVLLGPRFATRPVPHVALHRVVGGEPALPPREVPPPQMPVEIEEDPRVEPCSEPELEPVPIEPPDLATLPPLVQEPPRRRPDLTVVRRVGPPPELVVAPPIREPPPPAPIVPAVVGDATSPVPIDDANAPPPYPPRAIALRQEGSVLLRIDVGLDGRVLDCRIARSSGYTLLDEAASAAVRRWSFRGGGTVDLLVEFVLVGRGTVTFASPTGREAGPR